MRDECNLSTHDAGSATVLGIAVIVVLASMLALTASIGAWSVARSHAAMVADLAALAAASQGSCEAARAAATMHGARLIECSQLGSDATVLVRAPVPGASRLLPVTSVDAWARAGY